MNQNWQSGEEPNPETDFGLSGPNLSPVSTFL